MFEKNQRRYVRATYQCFLTIWERGGFSTIMTKTVNISAGGFLVNLDRGIMVGSKVDVRLDLPGNISLECSGRAQRCKEYTDKENSSNVFYAVAVSLDDLNEAQKLLIQNQVNKILSQQNIL